MNKDKIIYWTSTGLLSASMLLSAGMYLFNNSLAQEAYTALGYPVFLIYPLAVAKILGVIAILSKKVYLLKKYAYAGFFYVYVLAIFSHLMVGDGNWPGAFVGLVLWFVSFYYDGKLYSR